jgi:hypothetical protein
VRGGEQGPVPQHAVQDVGEQVGVEALHACGGALLRVCPKCYFLVVFYSALLASFI